MINRQRQHIILIGVACALLGFILARQFYLYKEVRNRTQPDQERDLALEVSQLITGNADLREELKKLEGQSEALQKANQDKRAAQTAVQESIKQYEITLGLVPVKGPGVSVQINQQLDTTQLTDLINALRNIGAEAITINNQRITPNTGWDNKTFNSPYTFQIIGDGKLIENALTRRGGIMEQIGFASKVKQESDLRLPAAK